MTVGGERTGESMGQRDGQGKQDVGLVAGVSEHQALVACSLFRGGNPAVDVLGLDPQPVEDLEAVHAERLILVGIADGLHGFADDGWDVEGGPGLQFSGDHDLVVLGEDLAGDVAGGILGEGGVEDAVRDEVADLVGVTFADRFGGEKLGVREMGGRV